TSGKPPDLLTPRFIANGGRGQDAGQGRAGLSQPAITQTWNMRMAVTGKGYVPVLDWGFRRQNWGWVVAQNGGWVQQPLPTVVYVEDPSGCGYGAGKQAWGDGDDAVPPGTPGAGGSGGGISSTIDVSAYAQIAGGASG